MESIIKNRISLINCTSTQRVASALAQSAKEGLLVQSEYQSKGQGQHKRRWDAAPGEGLLFTLLLRPKIAPKQLFLLNMAAACSLFDLLAAYSIPQLSIKWPNDIFSGDQKLAGMLIDSRIQNQRIQYTLVGIGLNVHQQMLNPRACSLQMLLPAAHPALDKKKLLSDWGKCFALRYAQLNDHNGHQLLHKFYEKNLFARGKKRLYATEIGQHFAASIMGITSFGQLIMQTEAGVKHFPSGSLKYIWTKC